MSPVAEKLVEYRKYHQNHKNLITHIFGIPLIVFSIILLLSRPEFYVGNIMLNPAIVAIPFIGYYYAKLQVNLALIMVGYITINSALAVSLDHLPTSLWLYTIAGCFVGGWALQFLGHYFEGKKPAFADDLSNLLIGPLYVVTELLFRADCFKSLEDEILDVEADLKSGD